MLFRITRGKNCRRSIVQRRMHGWLDAFKEYIWPRWDGRALRLCRSLARPDVPFNNGWPSIIRAVGKRCLTSLVRGSRPNSPAIGKRNSVNASRMGPHKTMGFRC